jgi:glycine cleavage system transcriptional repressor
MIHHLVVTAIGTDRTGVVNKVTRHVSECGCNIVDSRLAILGNEFTFIMLLSGDWNAITQIEYSLPRKSHELDLITLMKRTAPHTMGSYPMLAEAEILIHDEPGIVSLCTQFFSDQGWDIHALQSETIQQVPANLLRASFQLRLPVASAGSEEERSYAEFCQRLGAERFHFSITRKP